MGIKRTRAMIREEFHSDIGVGRVGWKGFRVAAGCGLQKEGFPKKRKNWVHLVFF